MDNCKQTNIPKVDNTDDNCCFTATDECITTTNALPTVGTAAGDTLESVLSELDTYISDIQAGVVSWGSITGDINNQTDLIGILNLKANDNEVVKSVNSILPDTNGNINVVEPTGLEAIDEGNGVGWRLIGSNPDFYGDIGNGAIDLSTQYVANNERGATGNNSVSIGGSSNTSSGNNSISIGGGVNNASGADSIVIGGSYNTAETDRSIIIGGQGNTTTNTNEVIIGGTSTIPSANHRDRIFNIGSGYYELGVPYRSDAFSIVLAGRSGGRNESVVGIEIDNFAEVHTNEKLQVGGLIKSNVTIAEIDAGLPETVPTKEWVQANSGIYSVVAGDGIIVDNTDASNPIIKAPTPSFQSVTDVSSATTNDVRLQGHTFIGDNTFDEGNIVLTQKSSGLGRSNSTAIYALTDNRIKFFKASSNFGMQFDYDGLTSTRNYIFPDKSGTVALLDDIPSPQPTPTFQEITAAGSTTTDSITIGEPVNSSDAATKNYVDNEISNIPPVDLSGYATLTDLDNVTITESQITDFKDYLRGDVDDNNGGNKLTLGSLEVNGQTSLQNVLKLNSVATGTSENILILNQSTGDVEQRVFSLGDIDIANAAGVSQFPVGLGDQLRIQGSGDTSVSFDGVTNTINISSTPGSGGGGAVTSFNGRDGAVVAQTGDYSTSMVNEGTNLYFTEGRVRSTELTGLSINNTPIGNTNTIIQALGRLQGQINNKENSFSKNSAFNKDFGTTAGTVAQGNDYRLTRANTAYNWGNHASAGYALASRTISAGTGLTGGGNLGGNRTINIGGNVTPLTATKIPGSQNLNSYQTPGFYYQSANADASSGSNYPADQAGSLVVQTAAGVTQQYYKYGTGTPEMWIRAFYSGTWTPWGKVWNSANDGSGSGLNADTVDGVHASSLARTSTTISAGTGLTGGGSLGSNRTINVNFGTASGTVAQGNDSRINNGQTAYSWGNHASAGYVPSGRTISAGTHLSGGGSLTTNRAINFTPETNNWIVDNQGNQRMYFGNTSSNIGTMFRASGTNQEFQYRNSSNSIMFRINHSGVATATNFVATSDERLKKNKKKIENALDKLDLISGYTWQWKRDGTESAGAMAQEVEKVLPEAVREDPDGIKGLNYNAIIGLLIEAVKELKKNG